MKTGSTAIQRWLAASKDALAAEGIYTPKILYSETNVHLTQAVQMLAKKQPLSSELSSYLRHLRNEITLLPSDAKNFVLSGEMLGQRLGTVGDIAALRKIFSPYFTKFRIIVYSRRQDEQIISQYSTKARFGRSGPVLGKPLDYYSMLNRWTEVFGKENIVPRIFDQFIMPDGDVVADFMSVLGVQLPKEPRVTARVNGSLQPVAQAFLIELGMLAKSRSVPFRGVGHKAVLDVIDQKYSGPGLMPTRGEVQKYMKKLHAANEKVRAEWFPQRKTLFHDDYSKYSEIEMPRPNKESVASIALEVALGLMAALNDGQTRKGNRRRKQVH